VDHGTYNIEVMLMTGGRLISMLVILEIMSMLDTYNMQWFIQIRRNSPFYLEFTQTICQLATSTLCLQSMRETGRKSMRLNVIIMSAITSHCRTPQTTLWS
jgi:hypothetical protein